MSLAERANDHFAVARKLMARQPRRIVRAPMLMAMIYQDMLERLVARGWAPPRQRIRADRGRLAWIVLRYGLMRLT
jgi:phytoene synthase